MGNCASQSEEQSVSKDIDRELTTSFRDGKREVKLLLLGTGESGKTTVIKQLRIIHTSGFSDDEIESWRENIHSNVITSMSALIKALEKSNMFDSLSEDEQRCAQLICSPKILTYTALVPEVTNAIRTLWQTQIVRDRFENKSDVQIIDSASYFFEHIDRISSPDYKPTQQDIVYSRVRTTGITEVRIPLGANRLKLVDVGGQRSERRKWLHCFQEVTGILYISAVNEFDQKLREDDTTNRVVESVNLFREVCSYEWFLSTPIILFLNKKDLLEEKIKKVNFKEHYNDFAGDAAKIENVLEYFKDMFQKHISGRANFYFHYTCATDTECIKVVFQAITQIIFASNMNEMGLF